MSIGKPIFNYPEKFKAPPGEGCPTCGIILEEDAILGFCSPECAEYEDRCDGCQRGPTWCVCEQIEAALSGEETVDEDHQIQD